MKYEERNQNSEYSRADAAASGTPEDVKIEAEQPAERGPAVEKNTAAAAEEAAASTAEQTADPAAAGTNAAGGAASDGTASASAEQSEAAETEDFIARLLTYYRDCLHAEAVHGVEAPLAGAGAPQYLRVESIPSDAAAAAAIGGDERAWLQQMQAQPHRKILFGYPVLLRRGLDWTDSADRFRIAPVFLYPVRPDGSVDLTARPLINPAVIRHYVGGGREAIDREIISLENDLQLHGRTAPPLETLVGQLRRSRSWEWRDILRPSSLRRDRIDWIEKAGIKNMAVYIGVEAADTHDSLQKELQAMLQLPASAFHGTALWDWAKAGCERTGAAEGEAAAAAPAQAPDDLPLLEPVPLNWEQREALRSAMMNPLTLVTGAPGTGKSQTAADVLINAVYRGKSVLFVGRSGRSLESLLQQIPTIGSVPWRTYPGDPEEDPGRLLDRLLNAARSARNPEQLQALRRELESCQQRIRQCALDMLEYINLRNDVDARQRQLEPYRARYAEAFRPDAAINVRSLESQWREYTQIKEALNCTHRPFWARLRWKKKKAELLAQAQTLTEGLLPLYCLAGLEAPRTETAVEQQDIKLTSGKMTRALRNLKAILSCQEDGERLGEMLPLEDLMQRREEAQARYCRLSAEYWRRWLADQAACIEPETLREMTVQLSSRNLLDGYPSSEASVRRRETDRALEKLLLDHVRCQMVSPEEARQQLPLTPGAYDLLVIDDAGFCTVPEVLPLLLRARRVVVFGDRSSDLERPALSRIRDANLIRQYGIRDFSWAYTTSSLLLLANSRGGRSVSLQENHRSHPDIFAFAEKEFYHRSSGAEETDHKARAIVVTPPSQLRIPPGRQSQPALFWTDVHGTMLPVKDGSARNDAEAKAAAAALRRLYEQEYRGTVGITALFGAQIPALREQIAQAFDSEVQQRDMEERFGLRIGTPAELAGEEFDAVLFSTVITAGPEKQLVNGLRRKAQQCCAAVTRARAALEIFGDRAFCADCGVRYLEDLSAYADSLADRYQRRRAARDESRRFAENMTRRVETPAAENAAHPAQTPEVLPAEDGETDSASGRAAAEDDTAPTLDELRKRLYLALTEAGLTLMPNYPEAEYVIDMALIDAKTDNGERKARLAIFVDPLWGEPWTSEYCYAEQLRITRLQSLGWDVVTFLGGQIRDRLEDCVEIVRFWSEVE